MTTPGTVKFSRRTLQYGVNHSVRQSLNYSVSQVASFSQRRAEMKISKVAQKTQQFK